MSDPMIRPPSSVGCTCTPSPTTAALRALAAATGELAAATRDLAASTARIEALLDLPPAPPLPTPRWRISTAARARARAAALAFAAEPGPGTAWTGGPNLRPPARPAGPAEAPPRGEITPPPRWIAVTDPATVPASAGRDAIFAALADVARGGRRPVAAALAELAPEPAELPTTTTTTTTGAPL